jgi:tripartite ATP-independent transporter DctP family solute receptor
MLTRRLALTSLAAAAARPARAQSATRLRISTAAPPSDFLPKALEQMKTTLDAGQTGLSLEIYPAGSLFKQGTEVPALQRGTLEMSTMTTFEVAQQIPDYGLFNRGYLFRDHDHMRRVFDGSIGETYRRMVADKMGIVILATAYLGTRQVNLRRRRGVLLPDDLTGVKMRMTPGPEWLLLGRTLGVSPVPMGMGEVYLALKTGTIDGQENPLSIMNAAKFYEITEQVIMTSHLLQPVFINIAAPVWNKLTPAQQAALQAAAQAAATANDTARLADEKTVAANLASQGLSVDTPDLDAFRAHADETYAASDYAKAWNADVLKQVQAVT